ncbi:uncharacterized protein LOC134834156 [Culicoides brevitarsis]|uniref:uncharacterized protein LOC134834156 n=1 Tax=Culicoides brevitarsis TaxID=469753 RepID=UPI00307B20A4
MEKSKPKRSVSPETELKLSNYKKSIQIMDSISISYTDKFQLLKKMWSNGGLLVEKCNKTASENVFKTLLNKTYPIVLVGEWSDIPCEERQHLRTLMEKCIANSVVDSEVVEKCKYLLKILDDPWFADTALAKILQAHPKLTPDEEREFHNNEMGPMMLIRLQKLCDTNCEELALNYSESCLRCIREDVEEFSTLRTHIYDQNLAMLVSLDKTDEFMQKVEQLTSDNAKEFIKRYTSKTPPPFPCSAEMKANLRKAAAVVASILLAKTIKEPIHGAKEKVVTYLTVLREWLTLHQHAENLKELVHNVLAGAISSQHLYYCSKIIERMDLRHLAIEVHIRGITQNINEIETKKYDGDVTAEEILKLESNMATQYMRLAEMFYDNEHVKRECYLTAFSLKPHSEIFEHVKRNRIIREDENDFNADDFKSIECTHVVVNANSSVSKVFCKYCGQYRNSDDAELVKSCEILLTKENLANVPASFHDDLVILVESPRIKQLSWSMSWHELEMNCQKLMDEERKLKLTSNQLVNANDQLQYIDLDYSLFIHLPEAEIPGGIEKGYEQFLASSDTESDSDDDEPSKPVKQEAKNFDKKSINYFESSDDSDDDYRMLRRKKGKSKGGQKRDENFTPSRRTSSIRPKYIDKSKVHVPPKKRIHRSMKKKFEFDYKDPHARFYITCRKAQLDIKKQRVRLLQKRDGKFFYEFLKEAQIKKPLSEDLVRKNIHKLSLLSRYNKRDKSERDKMERPGRQTKSKLLFSSGVTAIVNLNGSITCEKGEKRKRPTKPPSTNSTEIESESKTGETAEGNSDGTAKIKKPPRKSEGNSVEIGPDGLPVVKTKRSVKPKLGDDGQPLTKPVRRTKPKEKKPEGDAIPDDLSSKLEAAEILAQLGNATAATPAKIQNLKTKIFLDRKVLAEHNGVTEDRTSVDTKDDQLSDSNSRGRGRPKGAKNKVKVDADGNPLPKPLRKPHKSRLSSDTISVSSSDVSTLRASISSVASMQINGGFEEIKTEPMEIKKEEDDSEPPALELMASPKRKSCELSADEAGTNKKVAVEARNGEGTPKPRNPKDDYVGLTPEQKRELRLSKRREYDRKRRAKLREMKIVANIASGTSQNSSNAKPKAVKSAPKEKSLPPAPLDAGSNSSVKLEVTIPELPTESAKKVVPKSRSSTPKPSTEASSALDFESLIDVQIVHTSSAANKRLTRNSSRSNSPKPSKNNLPSHLIQTVNYSFTAHRYTDTSGYKKRYAKFVNYAKSCVSPSKTDKLSFNELRSIKDALNEEWTDEDRVELEQMMSRYWYDIHPCLKIKNESQILERRDYDSSVNNSKSDSHKSKNVVKAMIRRDYLPKKNNSMTRGNDENEFFRNERLMKSAESGETEFFLNNLMEQMPKSDVNDKKNHKNRFCKVLKYEVDTRNVPQNEDPKKNVTKSDEEVKNYLIATVPGMVDFEFFEMPEQERNTIVEIVHVKSDMSAKSSSDDSSSSSAPATSGSSNQNSSQQEKKDVKKAPTQVTAHIQRVGHPIQISKASTSTSVNEANRPKYLLQRTVTTATPSSSAASTSGVKNQTLINVLSHQVLVPGTKTGNKITVTNGAGGSAGAPVILNNFKQAGAQTPTKIVKSFPQNWTLSPSITTNAGSSPVTVSTVNSSQANSQHLLQILNSPPNVRKNLTITQQTSGKDDQNPKPTNSNNGVVQFICKTDGKMIHLTPINNVLQQSSDSTQPGQSIILNSLLKKPKEEDQDDDTTAPRSVYEENYANFIRTAPKTQQQVGQKPIQVVVSGASGTQFLQQIGPGNQLILQNNKIVAATTSGLPKFNQVFGKTVTMYQQSAGNNEISVADGKKDLLVDKKQQQHIIVQTTSATGATQNILIHNKTGRAQLLQTQPLQKSEGQPLKLLTTTQQGTATASTSSNDSPLRISVPLIPRSQQSMSIGQTRIVRPIIQLAPNVIKSETGQNVIVTTTPRQRLVQNPNIRVENLLLAQSSQAPATTPTTSTTTQSGKNVDTSTLEQLREFDMVLEQVKERSVTSVPSSPQPAQSPARPNQVTVINHVKASASSSVSSSPQQQQQIIYTTAQGTSVLQKVNFAFLQQQQQQQSGQATQKSSPSPSLGTPLMVVTNYNPTPAMSPALSVTSQLSSPTRSLSSVKSFSTKPITQSIAAKPKTMHSPGSASSSSKTLTPKSSPLPKPIQKPQEDEQTVQRIYDILAEYAEQLRNSPDLNNKPAPRRRSNPPTNPATPSNKKKKSGKKYQGGSDVNSDYEGNFESEDSSLGPGSVSGIPSTPSMNNFSPSEPEHSLMDDQSDVSMDQHPKPTSSSSQESAMELGKSTVAKQLVFGDASSESNSSNNKGMVLKESALNDVIAQAGKLGNNAAVLMPGNYLLPVNLLKSGRQIAILTSANGSKILAALPGTSNSKETLPTDKTGNSKTEPQQVLCLRTLPNNATQLILNPNAEKPSNAVQESSSSNPGTAIIISSPKGKKRYLINDPDLLAKLTKGGELSSADVKKLIELQENPGQTSATSVSQTQSKTLQMHKHINSSSNGDVELEENRHDAPISTQYQGKIIRSDRKIVDIQRNSHNNQQAALERELRLQKSLSEECEDLGVDEPEDLFPEAGLLFDSLDPSSQEHGMGIDTPKEKLTPIFFADEKRAKNSPQTVILKHEEVIKVEKKTEFTFSNDDSNLGASTEVKTEESKAKEDMYEFNTDEKSSDDNTDTEYNRLSHKKLGRFNHQPPMFSYKRKRSASNVVSPVKKRPKTEPAETTEDENDDMITIIDHHSNDGEDLEDVIDTNVVQSVGATLIVSTEKSTSPNTRRASTRGHVKKNCPCCKPKKNTQNHESPVTPSPVMTRKLRASIGSPSGSSTHSSSSPSTSSSVGGGGHETPTTASQQPESVSGGRGRGRGRHAKATTIELWKPSPIVVPVLRNLIQAF